MPSSKKNLKPVAATENLMPFTVPIIFKDNNFYYDRYQNNGEQIMTYGHYHNMHEIYYLTKGVCRYFIKNKLFDVKAGDIVCIPHGIIHKTLYLNVPVNRHLINFSKSYIPPSLAIELKNLFNKNIYRPKTELLPQIDYLFDKIATEYKDYDNYSNILISGYMTELFSLILRNPAYSEPSSLTNIPIENATTYISTNYKNNITLEDLADMTGLSPSYFSRLFKNTTGFGFKEYITIIRLKESQSKLIHTDKSICEIAYECGFNDSNYFSSVFKELNGLSPIKYRKQNRVKSEPKT